MKRGDQPAVDAASSAAYWEGNAETWTRHARAGYDVYRDALNTPAFLAMLPDVAGLDEAISYIAAHDAVWFATGSEIVAAWRQSGATF